MTKTKITLKQQPETTTGDLTPGDKFEWGGLLYILIPTTPNGRNAVNLGTGELWSMGTETKVRLIHEIEIKEV